MLDVRRWFVTKVSNGHSCGHIKGCQDPEEDHREETAPGEDDQGVLDVTEGADEHDDGEQEENSQEPHGDRPKQLFNSHSS